MVSKPLGNCKNPEEGNFEEGLLWGGPHERDKAAKNGPNPLGKWLTGSSRVSSRKLHSALRRANAVFRVLKTGPEMHSEAIFCNEIDGFAAKRAQEHSDAKYASPPGVPPGVPPGGRTEESEKLPTIWVSHSAAANPSGEPRRGTATICERTGRNGAKDNWLVAAKRS